MEKTKLDPAKLEDICVGMSHQLVRILSMNLSVFILIGTCHPPSPTYVSRAAAIAAGVPVEVPVSAVNRLCGSGLQAIRIIANAIQAGHMSLGMAIGVENMSLKYVHVLNEKLSSYLVVVRAQLPKL